MNLKVATLLLLLSSMSCRCFLHAQNIPKEELIFLTSEWKGERFADGRPKIPDDLLERAKQIMVDDAWTVLKNEGYLNQFEGGWKTVNDTPMAGRALTAMYMPSVPLWKKYQSTRRKAGRKGNNSGRSYADQGDLYVADAYGKLAW